MKMTLEEWKATDKATREKLEAECYRRGTPRQIGEIAEQAAEALLKALEGQSQVTSVRVGEDYTAKRVLLSVSTLLHEGEELAAVPEEFAGFPVVQFGMVDRKRDFLKRLEFVLRAIDFPSAEFDALLQRFDRQLGNIGSAHYLETPGRSIAEVLITLPASNHLKGMPLVALRGDLCDAIDDFFKETDPVRIGFNAQAMSRLREVLKAIFSKHGVSICASQMSRQTVRRELARLWPARSRLATRACRTALDAAASLRSVGVGCIESNALEWKSEIRNWKC